MRERKIHFEVVPLAEVAHLADVVHPEPTSRPRVLSVSHDSSLLRTRELLFSHAGFYVASFLDTNKAIARCDENDFDLIVVGHSIPLAERKALVKALRRKCAAPILALTRPGETTLVEADYLFDPIGPPALLLETAQKILALHKERG